MNIDRTRCVLYLSILKEHPSSQSVLMVKNVKDHFDNIRDDNTKGINQTLYVEYATHCTTLCAEYNGTT
jgi:hypothetical protein